MSCAIWPKCSIIFGRIVCLFFWLNCLGPSGHVIYRANILAEMVGMFLCGNLQQSVINGGHSAKLTVVPLPADIHVPQLVRLEVQSTSTHCPLEQPKGKDRNSIESTAKPL